MKHVVEFRDERVQAMAEALFPPEMVRFQMVSKAIRVSPTDAEQRAVFEDIIKEQEADLKRARQLLALVDVAVALNGGSYDRILKFSDNPEDNPSGKTE